MKVEFLENSNYGNGFILIIEGSEFYKENERDVFTSFAFATDCFFTKFGIAHIFSKEEFEKIKNSTNKTGKIIVSVVEEKYPNRAYPIVYSSNDNLLNEVRYWEV